MKPEIEALIMAAVHDLTVDNVPPSAPMVAKRLGRKVSHRTILKAMRRNGITPGPTGRRPAITESEAKDLLVEYMSSEVSFRELGRRMGCVYGCIERALMKVNGGVLPARAPSIVEVEVEQKPQKVRPCMKCQAVQVVGGHFCKKCKAENARLSSSLG